MQREELASSYLRAFRVLGVILMTGMTLGVMEGMTRLLAPQQTYTEMARRFIVNGKANSNIPFVEPSEIFPFAMMPGFKGSVFDRAYQLQFSVTINGKGFRTHEFVSKAPDEIRIVAIGDSTTYGHGVDGGATYPELLESMLRSKTPGDPKVRVFNLGVGDYGPVEYYLLAKTYLPLLKPDITIVAFFTGNDIADLFRLVETDTDGLPVKSRIGGMYVDEQHRWRTNSIRSWVYRLPILRESHLAIFTDILAARAYDLIGRRMRRLEEVQPPIPLDRLVQGIQSISAKAGAKTVWVILPARYDLELGLDRRKTPYFLRAIATLPEPRVVNLVPELKKTAEDLPSYYVEGSHFSRRGNEAIAMALIAPIGELLRQGVHSERKVEAESIER